MKKVIGVIFVLGIIGLGSYFLLLKQEGFEFTVKNQTNKEITGLYLTYNHINSDIKKFPQSSQAKKLSYM
ncbi:hypothetical protein P4534_18805 [Peribacillus butanolivorans]|uniref:hypothetical protein n=1 Tax=Peribacillus butanolivorans TaxID=421767 RepID=UPI002E24DC1B|nr:hypothetical protein [Peribacillus butanolivorans]